MTPRTIARLAILVVFLLGCSSPKTREAGFTTIDPHRYYADFAEAFDVANEGWLSVVPERDAKGETLYLLEMIYTQWPPREFGRLAILRADGTTELCHYSRAEGMACRLVPSLIIRAVEARLGGEPFAFPKPDVVVAGRASVGGNYYIGTRRGESGGPAMLFRSSSPEPAAELPPMFAHVDYLYELADTLAFCFTFPGGPAGDRAVIAYISKTDFKETRRVEIPRLRPILGLGWWHGVEMDYAGRYAYCGASRNPPVEGWSFLLDTQSGEWSEIGYPGGLPFCFPGGTPRVSDSPRMRDVAIRADRGIYMLDDEQLTAAQRAGK